MTKEILTEFEAGERLDKAVALAYPKYSRSSIEKLIESGDILVNSQPAKAKYKLKESDKISLDFSSLDKQVADIELPLIYEDDNVVVINKPAGVLAHSKGTLNNEPTVASWLNNKYGDKSDFWQSNRAGIVHRLDRATSGVMICAKTEEAQKFLQKQFAKRNVKKTYLAVVEGQLKLKDGMIDVPIERNPKKPATFRPGVNGKSAQTHFRVIAENGKYSLIELKPVTGRTHQLRVHLKHLGHPIVGDIVYGKARSDNKLYLLAQSLEITLPDSQRRTFSVDTPEFFDKIMEASYD